MSHISVRALLVALSLGLVAAGAMQAVAGVMAKDPSGFYGIPWGARLADVQDLVQVESGEDVQAYELKKGPPSLGEARVESLRFVTFKGKFARATIRYRGDQSHTQILAYLESQFGAADRSPGSMMRGLNQQFNWRGPDTEVNLTYEAFQGRGFVFIESRVLAPRFNDVLPEHNF